MEMDTIRVKSKKTNPTNILLQSSCSACVGAHRVNGPNQSSIDGMQSLVRMHDLFAVNPH